MIRSRGRPAGDPPKVGAVVARMTARIAQGTYLTLPLPTEHDLAVDMQVSYLTARRAVAQLVEKGLLRRAPRGRLELATKSDAGSRSLQVAFAVVSWNSFDVLRWYRALGEAAGKASRPVAITTAIIHGWDDPLLASLAAKADGVVVYPGNWDRTRLSALLSQARAQLIAVDRDCSDSGLVSLCPCPAEGMDALLDHLWARGHRRIACVGAVPGNDVEAARSARYAAWCCARGINAQRIANDRACVTSFMLGSERPTAIIAIAVADALTTVRVAHEHRVAVPEQLAVAVVNDEGLGEVVVPSLTSLAIPDLSTDLGRALDWFGGGAQPWPASPGIVSGILTVAQRESG